MSDNSTNLQLPYLQASQAQKHVTVNEGLQLLDALVMPAVEDKDLTTPPGSPADGSRYIPASGATGAWATWDFNIAYRVDGAWQKIVPREGFLAYVRDEDLFYVYNGSVWNAFSGSGTTTLTGDVTGSGSGSIATTIANNAVSNAKLRDSAALSVIGNATNATADPADIAAGTDGFVLRRLGTALGFGTVATAGLAANAADNTIIRDSAALSVIGNATNATADPADITAGTDGFVLRRSGTALGFGTVATAGLAANAADNTIIRDSAGLSVIGNATNATADPADITAGTDGFVLRRSGTALGFGTVATAGHADQSVTYAKLQNVSATSRLLGRASAGAGSAEELTASQALDFVGSTRGSLLERGSGGWAAITPGTNGYPLVSSGSGADPAYAQLSLTAGVTGTLPVANGGTGSTTGNVNIADIAFVIDGAGSTITTGLKGYLEIPFDCTINRATLLADQSGSVVVNIWKCTYSQFDAGTTHPVSGDKITASAPPTISSAKKAQDATLTGWTTSITAGDILAFNVDSVTTIQRVTLSLKVTKT